MITDKFHYNNLQSLRSAFVEQPGPPTNNNKTELVGNISGPIHKLCDSSEVEVNKFRGRQDKSK